MATPTKGCLKMSIKRKMIGLMWYEYRMNTIPLGISDTYISFLRRCFYTGSVSGLNELVARANKFGFEDPRAAITEESLHVLWLRYHAAVIIPAGAGVTRDVLLEANRAFEAGCCELLEELKAFAILNTMDAIEAQLDAVQAEYHSFQDMMKKGL